MAKNKDLYPDDIEESKVSNDQRPNLREVIEKNNNQTKKNVTKDAKQMENGQLNSVSTNDKNELISKEVSQIIKKTSFGLLPMFKKIKINDIEAL
jgi:hypothetical protein